MEDNGSVFGPMRDDWPDGAIQVTLGLPRGQLLPEELPELSERLRLAATLIVEDIVERRGAA